MCKGGVGTWSLCWVPWLYIVLVVAFLRAPPKPPDRRLFVVGKQRIAAMPVCPDNFLHCRQPEMVWKA